MLCIVFEDVNDVRLWLCFFDEGVMSVLMPCLGSSGFLYRTEYTSNEHPCQGTCFFRSGLGPSLRTRSVICLAALAKACAWLPDM